MPSKVIVILTSIITDWFLRNRQYSYNGRSNKMYFLIVRNVKYVDNRMWISYFNIDTCSSLKCCLIFMIILCLQNRSSGKWPPWERNNPHELKVNLGGSAGLVQNSKLRPNWHTHKINIHMNLQGHPAWTDSPLGFLIIINSQWAELTYSKYLFSKYSCIGFFTFTTWPKPKEVKEEELLKLPCTIQASWKHFLLE